MTDIFADDFSADPYWWDDIPQDTSAGLPLDALPSRADVVVVGSGYAGLQAAITLAQTGNDVVLLEAGPLGLGASTRNGGMVSGGVNVGKHTVLEPAREAELLAEAAESYGWFEAFILTMTLMLSTSAADGSSGRIPARLGSVSRRLWNG